MCPYPSRMSCLPGSGSYMLLDREEAPGCKTERGGKGASPVLFFSLTCFGSPCLLSLSVPLVPPCRSSSTYMPGLGRTVLVTGKWGMWTHGLVTRKWHDWNPRGDQGDWCISPYLSYCILNINLKCGRIWYFLSPICFQTLNARKAASLLDSGVQRISMIVRQEQSFGTRNYVGPYHILQLRQQPVKGRRAMGEPILSQISSKFGRIQGTWY